MHTSVTVPPDDRLLFPLSLGEQAEDRCLVVFDRSDEATVQAGEQGIRFLLCGSDVVRIGTDVRYGTDPMEKTAAA